MEKSYLQWLAEETTTKWWHDSADPEELKKGLIHKACGATTNPVLVATTLKTSGEYWRSKHQALPSNPKERAETLLKCVVQDAAKSLEDQYHRTGGKYGYVCAQVDPNLAADADRMIDAAKKFSAWAPNISIKLPATSAGLDALEECVSRGISVTATISFSVPQVVAIAEKHKKGQAKAAKAGVNPGRCFAVIMIGRLDDYLRDAAKDVNANVEESDITQAGIAITKRAYAILTQGGYQAEIIVAALRGTYHVETMTGANVIMSVHPSCQKLLLADGVPRKSHQIDVPVDPKVITRLMKIKEFARAYEPDGMTAGEFIAWGLTQRTLSQFIWAGWSCLENYKA
jgi:transaldolase